jgi:hypothetical protein
MEIRMVPLGQLPKRSLDFFIPCLRLQAERSIKTTQELPRAVIMDEQALAQSAQGEDLVRTTGIGLYAGAPGLDQ